MGGGLDGGPGARCWERSTTGSVSQPLPRRRRTDQGDPLPAVRGVRYARRNTIQSGRETWLDDATATTARVRQVLPPGAMEDTK